jgi:GntR family transcriptional regulator/MocR family aminotransferase
MPIEWAGLGPELLLRLDRTKSQPLRAQLEEGVREAVRTGRLAPGERLPSSRELARQLGVSRGLVQECYGQLHAEGYLSTRVGSATRVAQVGAGVVAPAPPQPDVPAVALTADFQSGVPDLASFPRGDWLWAQRESLPSAPTAVFDYGDPRGSTVLREVLAGYLRRVRAAASDPQRMVMCNGFAEGLVLTLRVLQSTGIRRVGFEDPGYGDGETLAAAVHCGVDAIPVPVDESGIDVSALKASGARAVLVTPAHQWPTGVVLTPQRRHALVAWAQECDGVIIEDDYDAEFRYDRDPVGAVHGLAADRVVHLGTVSKSLAPAVRLGWILCPPWLADALIDEKKLTDRSSPVLDQLTLATLVQSGRYDRHLRRMRTLYRRRRQALVDTLGAHAPQIRLTGLAAGFHAVAHLPAHLDEATVIAAARDQSVGLYGMSTHRANRSTVPPRLVLGFGNLTERTITRGIATIADVLTGRRQDRG